MFWTRKLDSLDSGNVDAFHIPSDLNLVTSDADRVTPGRASISGARCNPGRSRSGASGLILFDGIILRRDGLNRFGSEFSNLQSAFKTYKLMYQDHRRRRSDSSRIQDCGVGHISISTCATNFSPDMNTHESCAQFGRC